MALPERLKNCIGQFITGGADMEFFPDVGVAIPAGTGAHALSVRATAHMLIEAFRAMWFTQLPMGRCLGIKAHSHLAASLGRRQPM